MGTMDDLIEPAAVQNLVARWWWSYDDGAFDFLESHVTDDVHFGCRTDTGNAEWEDFVRADVRGRDAFMDWQVQHRVDSPYPLRHSGTNVHIVERRGNEATFACYVVVTHVADGRVAHLPGGMVNGTVRLVDGELRISELEVVLDTMDSVPFRDIRTLKR
jgi:hypothetical protein